MSSTTCQQYHPQGCGGGGRAEFFCCLFSPTDRPKPQVPQRVVSMLLPSVTLFFFSFSGHNLYSLLITIVTEKKKVARGKILKATHFYKLEIGKGEDLLLVGQCHSLLVRKLKTKKKKPQTKKQRNKRNFRKCMDIVLPYPLEKEII